ncbi:hypothetical protein ACA910_010683 [Epithemia clementina (nom. ined.)]
MRLISLVLVCCLISTNHSFQESGVTTVHHDLRLIATVKPTIDITLWSSPKRTARRDLRKRRRRNKGTDDRNVEADTETDDASWKISEVRPLIKSYAREQGVDYWMDEEELQKYSESLRRKPREAGQVPDEKLWKEVLSPYRENWIGLFSVLIVVIATIVVNFPELLQPPVIEIPDL